MKIFIVEDDDLQLESIVMSVEENGYEIAGYTDHADYAIDLIKDLKPDVVLVDIALPGKNNGITLGDWLNKEMKIPHIFITSFRDDETIKEAILTNPVTYLTKPVEPTMLKAAVELSKQKLDKLEDLSGSEEIFYVKVGNKYVKIDAREVRWLEAAGQNYSYIAFSKQNKYAVRSTLKELGKKFHFPEFVQIHRAFIANFNFVDSINDKDQIVYINKNEIPIGRTYRKRIDILMNKL
jgi:DNA-binding LytR/AlgR family response regulator